MTLKVLNFPDGFTSATAPVELGGAIIVYDVESIIVSGSVSSSLTIGFQQRPVIGDGGAVTTANDVFGSVGGWLNGTQITLIGTDDTNTVTIPFSNTAYGCLVNGNATLENGYTLTLQWNETIERWFEISRNF